MQDSSQILEKPVDNPNQSQEPLAQLEEICASSRQSDDENQISYNFKVL